MTDAGGAVVRLEVDQEVCIGMGQCELLEPEQFRVDDDSGVASAIGDGVSPERAADLIDRCPSGAIRFATVDGEARS